VPAAPDGDKFVEVIPEEQGEDYLAGEESAFETLALDEQADAISETASSYTDDEQIAEDFAERQGLYSGGRDELQETLEEYHSLSPILSGGDIDAAWEDSNVAGEESVGGSVLTPDQDVVDELGEAAGITYRDDEPLDTEEKLRRRDEDRWELDPRSNDDEEGGFEEE
jgi:hypothetical protein